MSGCWNSWSKFAKQLYEKGLQLWKKDEVRSPNEFQLFCKFLYWHGINGQSRPLYSNFWSVSGHVILAEVWSQEIAGVWNQEVARIRRSRTGETLESRTFEPARSDRRNSGVMDGGFGNQKESKSKTLPQKSGFGVWTSGRLVNVWNQPRKSRDVKDIYLHVHTGNIP
jgi:hypothetical protein